MSEQEKQNTISLFGSVPKKMEGMDEIDYILELASVYSMEVHLNLPPDIDTSFTEHINISFLKKYKIVPIKTTTENFIAANHPDNFQAADDLARRLHRQSVPVVLAPTNAIMNAITYAYDMTQTTAEEMMQDIQDEDPEQLFSEIEETSDLLDDTSDSPVIRLVNLMFSQAVRSKASDIHIEPYQNSVKIRQRLDGILYDMITAPKHVQAALTSRVKIMAKLDIAEKRLPQDGRIEIKVANKDIDVRVSTLPTALGERVVLRLLDKASVLISLTKLGMPKDRFDIFAKQIKAPNGIVLVTGPTGSGKTTTLYAALASINNVDINIITVEDPVEYRIHGIGQVQVNPKIDLTFASGLRSILRQDPDVILVGEIRDSETAEIAIQAALTGHLVFSTLHTNDSASAITRLRDMKIEPFLITSSVNAILAQRLVRIICTDCKEKYYPPTEEWEKIGVILNPDEKKIAYRGRGCRQCNHTGFKGRCGIFELLPMTQEMKSLVLKTSDANELKQLAVKQGMVTLLHDGANKVAAGITTIEEVYRISQS